MNELMIDKTNTESYPMAGKCPFGGDRIGGALGSRPALENWYPHRLRVELLHQNGVASDPLGPDFDYAGAFRTIDLDALKSDIKQFLTSSVAWWPSDYGELRPADDPHGLAFGRNLSDRGWARRCRHRACSASRRSASWWDNGNTDKSRRLLQPIKHKYGNALSWADLMVLTGNCALEIMGLPTYGFGGGRLDAWEADNATYWGPEVVDMGTVSSFDDMVNRDKRWRGQERRRRL